MLNVFLCSSDDLVSRGGYLSICKSREPPTRAHAHAADGRSPGGKHSCALSRVEAWLRSAALGCPWLRLAASKSFAAIGAVLLR
eukprot:6203250-Pleurochrysis_carterae.AAC.1